MSRFDYVAYDEHAQFLQNDAKKKVQALEFLIGDVAVGTGSSSVNRAKALAMTKLEECYMWLGKAIRDDQIARNGSALLQEERNNS